MTAPHESPPLGSLALIAVFVVAVAAAFAYTAGWFSPPRLTPGKLVDAFAPPSGVALGHRRNHAALLLLMLEAASADLVSPSA